MSSVPSQLQWMKALGLQEGAGRDCACGVWGVGVASPMHHDKVHQLLILASPTGCPLDPEAIERIMESHITRRPIVFNPCNDLIQRAKFP